MQISHYLPRRLPQRVRGLASLALDLRWSWNHGADALWCRVDPELWEATANPWLILESVSDRRLAELAADSGFVSALEQELAARKEHFQAEAWFPTQVGKRFSGQIAYFCMEFGLSESLPIYSGGLGVLAGDCLKTACDLDVPLVGIGLLYQQGYFRQALDDRGDQIEFHPFNDPTMLPVVPLRDENGAWMHVPMTLPGRPLWLRAWHARVGRRTLLLLDSNSQFNQPGDRGITSELYGGGPEVRLQQEMVLGIGGWRLLEALGIDCSVCHLNEGHAAFAVLERARALMQRDGHSFASALWATRAGNLFTTHTPVAAGFDQFPAELFSRYFREYAQELGITLNDLLALGRQHPDDDCEPFNMAYLALRGCAAVNGVSARHGEVSRQILQPLFPRWPTREVPVGHVTNGVHMPSWDSAAADALWTRACGKARWRGTLETLEADLRQLDDDVLWAFRVDGRKRLVTFLRERLKRQHRLPGGCGEWGGDACLDVDVLTLGFARRFAGYKRSNLLLQDPQRLLALLNRRDRPLQLVISGKAHPRDAEGKSLLREWQTFLRQPEVRGRVVFVEDYDLEVAGQLIQGVDVWLNTPRRPWEACGTSGMKVLVNGGINLSELDGWWAEAFAPEVGWMLGDAAWQDEDAERDRREAEQLYRLLEDEVVPCFYRRDAAGVPRDWVNRMRESMARLTPTYSSNRMLREYVETYYLPLLESFRRRTPEVVEALGQWHGQLVQHWARMYFGNVVTSTTESGHHFEVQVYLDDMPPQAVRVELYAEAAGGLSPARQVLERQEPLAGNTNAYIYRGSVTGDRPVEAFTARIVPHHAEAQVPLEAGFILWHH